MDPNFNLGNFKNSLLSIVSTNPLYNAVTYYPCQHKVNEEDALNWLKTAGNQGDKCIICRSPYSNWGSDPVVREIVRKIFAAYIVDDPEVLKPFFVCPVSDQPLLNAVTLNPCGHKVDEVRAKALYSKPDKEKCKTCSTSVKEFHPDPIFRGLARIFFEHFNEKTKFEQLHKDSEIIDATLENTLVFEPWEIRRGLSLHNQLIIQPNQNFIIKGLTKEQCEEFDCDDMNHLLQQVIGLFNHILLPISKSVIFTEVNGKLGFGRSPDQGVIILEAHDSDFKMLVGHHELLITLSDLLPRMAKEDFLTLKVMPNQILFITDIDEDTLEEILEKPSIALLNQFFISKRCPIGFQLSIDFFRGSAMLQKGTLNNGEKALTIVAKKGFNICLKNIE